MNDWRAPKTLAAGQRLVIDVATVEVMRRLRRLAIEAIVLKGPTIARWLYPEGTRVYGDIDLLVERDSVARAGAVLEEIGFARPYEHHLVQALSHDRHLSALAWERDHDQTRVELHPNIVGVNAHPTITWTILREHAQPFEIAGDEVLALDIPGRILSIALHVAQHWHAFPHPLEDLRRALAALSMEEWEAASRLAEALDAMDSFSAGLRTLPEGRAVADHLGLRSETALHVAMHAGGARSSARELEWLVRTEGIWWKARLVVRKLFPPVAFVRNWSPLARRGLPGLAAAYLYRPIWLLKELVLGAIDLTRFRRRARNQR